MDSPGRDRRRQLRSPTSNEAHSTDRKQAEGRGLGNDVHHVQLGIVATAYRIPALHTERATSKAVAKVRCGDAELVRSIAAHGYG